MTQKNNPKEEVEKLFIDDEEQEETVKHKKKRTKKRKGPKIFLTIVFVVILALVILLVVSKVTDYNIFNLPKGDYVAKENVKAGDWQAVFLSNGQVYFGKLKNVNSAYPVLEDIYYLQVQEVPIQPAEPAGGQAGVQPAQQTTQQTILVKFGTEIHKPMDKMFLNRDHILFYEDLAEDSDVINSIKAYKEQELEKQNAPIDGEDVSPEMQPQQ
jgi:hypothetical protein